MERMLVWMAMLFSLALPVKAQNESPATCTILGAGNAGSEQQIRVYPGPEFANWDGIRAIPDETVEFRDYINNKDAGEEWFKVFFPGSGTEYWVIRYHINCPSELWND